MLRYRLASVATLGLAGGVASVLLFVCGPRWLDNALGVDTMGNQSASDRQAICEKYRPRTLEAFAGLDKPKRAMTALAARPFPSAWVFVGPSGVGKTTMALAFGEQIRAEVHHVPSQNCDAATVRDLYRVCHFAPLSGDWHVIIVDEADQMTPGAQLAFLSKLDSTAPFPHTIVIFTANSTDGLEKRFLSRCKVLEFSSYGMAAEARALLERIWSLEAPGKDAPDFARIVKDSTNNVRDALNRLELEAMLA